jgi:hypothetical protein
MITNTGTARPLDKITRITADTCAPGPTGANYRASLGSGLDFALIADYSRLMLGLPRHGTCEQMPQFCAAA